MQVVIELNKRLYADIKDSWSITLSSKNTDKVIRAVKNGTPLPKGHGRLIDADKLNEEIYVIDAYSEEAVREQISDADTIIEADTAEGSGEE